MIPLKNILVATDFNEPAEAALRYGVELCKTFRAKLHVLNVVDDLAAHATAMPPAGFELGQLQTNLENDARANLAAVVPESDRSALRAQLDIAVSTTPARAILAYARDLSIDLIIVGTHGRRGLARFVMGSVAQEVGRLAHCPVLTVRAHADDFVRPDVDQQVRASEQSIANRA